MKKPIVTILLFMILPYTYAQNITEMEYFIDTDPGYGNGTTLSFTPGKDVTSNFILGTSPGMHILYIRAKDNAGTWGATIIQPFVTENVTSSRNITEMEYFVDVDPGYGNGINVPVTPGVNINSSFVINTAGYTSGLHVLYVRTKDEQNRWSICSITPFFNTVLTSNIPIVGLEYFVDSDPGYGNGTSVSITPGTRVSTVFNMGWSGLSPGIHVLFVRALNNNHTWSMASIIPFIAEEIIPDKHVTAMEYFFDNDPGFGNGEPVPFIHGKDLNQMFFIDLDTLTAGNHHLFVRVKDTLGSWSQTTHKGISVFDSKFFLEGLYDPGLSSMHEAYDENGNPAIATGIADSVTILFADDTPPYDFLISFNNLLTVDGHTRFIVPEEFPDAYYLVIRHRNSIETWSSTPVNFFAGPTYEFNFAEGAAFAYGSNQLLIGTDYAFYTGDVNQDGTVDSNDMGELDNSSSNFEMGYTDTDLNGDGIVDTNDLGLADNNSSSFIMMMRP